MPVDALLVAQAFVASILGFFAPCSVGMLPAYVGYLLGESSGGGAAAPSRAHRWAGAAAVALGGLLVALGLFELQRVNLGAAALTLAPLAALAGGGALAVTGFVALASTRAVRGLAIGAQASLGVVAVLVVVGAPVAILASGLLTLGRLAALLAVLGLVLATLGVATLLGRDPTVPFGFAAPTRVPRPLRAFVFGVVYGLVSLGCNFPLFAFLVASALATGGAVDAFATFAVYAFGVATLLVPIAAAVATGRGVAVVRAASRHVKTATGALLVVAGLYMAYYYGVVLLTGGPPAWALRVLG